MQDLPAGASQAADPGGPAGGGASPQWHVASLLGGASIPCPLLCEVSQRGPKPVRPSWRPAMAAKAEDSVRAPAPPRRRSVEKAASAWVAGAAATRTLGSAALLGHIPPITCMFHRQRGSWSPAAGPRCRSVREQRALRIRD